MTRKPVTRLTDHEPGFEDVTGEPSFKIDVEKLAPVEPYRVWTDVPISLRAHIRTLTEKGMPPGELARIFGLQEEWVSKILEK